MKPDWAVLKFGGTSVAGKPQWETIRDLLQQHLAEGKRILLVCSAVSGITNRLAALADHPDELSLEAILDIHDGLAVELGVPANEWLEQARLRMLSCLERLAVGENHAAKAELLATGEWLSTHIGAAYLAGFFPVDWMDVRDHLQAREEPELSPARQWLSASCQSGADIEFQEMCQALSPVLVTQGYIAANRNGETVLLGRGGSDTSAALLAGRLGADCVEIWTDVPGLFSADPRMLPEARLLEELDFAEALEMAASGAKVVHPSCIRAAADSSTTIVIRDTSRPGLAGTRITHMDHSGSGVKTITCQRDMLVLLLQKIDNRREVGFLASVFDIFRRRGISVDLVATSETTTTLAINKVANLLEETSMAQLVAALEAHCTVAIYEDCVCVNLVGRAVRTVLSRVQESMVYFDEQPLLMLSLSANDLCLSLLMPAGNHEMLVQNLHDEIIRQGGPSWEELRRWA